MENQESSYLLKMVQQLVGRGETNGVKDVSEDYIGVGDEHAMTFDIKDVIHLAVEDVGFNVRDDSQNGNHLLNFLHFLIVIAMSRLRFPDGY